MAAAHSSPPQNSTNLREVRTAHWASAGESASSAVCRALRRGSSTADRVVWDRAARMEDAAVAVDTANQVPVDLQVEMVELDHKIQ